VSEQNQTGDSFNRRSALKLIGTGVTLPSAMGVVSGKKRTDWVEITMLKKDGEPLLTKEVPKKWYKLEQRAEHVQNKILPKFEKKEGVIASAVTNSDEKIHDWNKPKVQLVVKPNHADIELPNRLAGIQVEKFVEDDSPESTCSESDYQQDFDEVPAGVEITMDGWAVSAGWWVKKDGKDRLMTCAHIFDEEECGGDAVGTTVRQGGEKFGEISSIYPNIDVVLVDTSYGGDLQDNIYGISGECVDRVGRDGLNDIRATGSRVSKAGSSTCNTNGTITKIEEYASGCVTNTYGNYYGVNLDIETDEGDSGGPIYYSTWDWVEYNHGLIGLCSYRYGDNKHRATAAYHVEDVISGIDFDPDPTIL